MVSAVSWLLDTNIISEAMRPRPEVAVMENLARYDGELAIPAPVWHELRYGWLRMPEGQRKDAVGRFVQDVVGTLPILPYDGAAARIHAELRQSREGAGFTLLFVDGQIASVAIAHGLTLVTRNTKDFAELAGLRLTSWFGL
ncbi:type II toxin-antitoxin system VapC family toxin [Cupriavidus sp. AcVe19-1a]|uniref:type II toxin-antitoxin system VapC family toxin n=1 Tax=Cupriavidus sp. AcVe19-1a TaxID=2821359 RepID=UPI001AE36547|nr:type II toxin-antitoxin system VapC family toxin [Cupriavidus sp. AcVe19-1a]MBP0633395.1 type II toxin-antitoxin system VapC family toxin [Cupriavidus sp. AcVe19-1a]